VHRGLFGLAIASLVSLHACERITSTFERSEPVSASSIGVECMVDDDCGLMPPLMTCCGECDPSPPFEAVPRTAIDARLIDLENYCAERGQACDPPICEIAPPGCVARAICVRGTCQVVESGCAVLVADQAPEASCPGSLPSTFA
jgi:hypothetical protein